MDKILDEKQFGDVFVEEIQQIGDSETLFCLSKGQIVVAESGYPGKIKGSFKSEINKSWKFKAIVTYKDQFGIISCSNKSNYIELFDRESFTLTFNSAKKLNICDCLVDVDDDNRTLLKLLLVEHKNNKYAVINYQTGNKTYEIESKTGIQFWVILITVSKL